MVCRVHEDWLRYLWNGLLAIPLSTHRGSSSACHKKRPRSLTLCVVVEEVCMQRSLVGRELVGLELLRVCAPLLSCCSTSSIAGGLRACSGSVHRARFYNLCHRRGGLHHALDGHSRGRAGCQVSC